MNDSQIRAEQLEAGRHLGGTLRAATVLRTQPRKTKSAPVPKGHEAFLKALESSGATVYFEKVSSGAVVKGLLKHSDKFTVSVLEDGGQTRVLFKHDISEFWTVAAATVAQ